jgi:hypothetical protein
MSLSWSGPGNRDNTELFQTKSDKVSFDIISNLHSLARVPKKDNYTIPQKNVIDRIKKSLPHPKTSSLASFSTPLSTQLKLPPSSYLKTQTASSQTLHLALQSTDPIFSAFGEVAPLCVQVSSTMEAGRLRVRLWS